jgi:hypothetical protein
MIAERFILALKDLAAVLVFCSQNGQHRIIISF